MTDDTPVRVRDMPWEDMMDVLRTIGPEVMRLAKRGDRFAMRVLERYQFGFEHPTDSQANFELRTAVEDYVSRDLRPGERFDLASKYGHRLPEGHEDKTHGPRIVVPATVAKQ
jgi:hypothetical protein